MFRFVRIKPSLCHSLGLRRTSKVLHKSVHRVPAGSTEVGLPNGERAMSAFSPHGVPDMAPGSQGGGVPAGSTSLTAPRDAMAKVPFLLKKQPLVANMVLAREIRPGAQQDLPEPEVDVDDIQGDALRGFNKPYLAILTFNMVDKSPATLQNTKKWLAESVVPNVTSARDIMEFRQMFRLMREKRGGVKPKAVVQICLNVSFSYDALCLLAPPQDVAKFYQPSSDSIAFKIGLPLRSAMLNDPQTGVIEAMKNLKVGAVKNPHIMIQIGSDRESLVEEEIADLLKGLDALSNPLKMTYRETGKRRKDLPGHEHFGFLDGISNFGPRGIYQDQGTTKKAYITPRFLDKDDKRSELYGLPGQNLVWPGEAILGLPKQNHNTVYPSQFLPGSSDFVGPDWAKNGTFVVFRRLRQDVPKFWKFLKENAEELAKRSDMKGFTDEHMGAKIVSRWKSGAPVIREPKADNPELGNDRLANNAFLYQTKETPSKMKPHGHTDKFPQGNPDPFGKVCPLSSHLRKVQPRDCSTDIGNHLDTLKHRIIRRGIQYGDPIKDVFVDDGVDRGLLFICYQASIDKQFEFLITTWANSALNPHSGGGHDMVIGQSDAPNRERSFDVRLPDDDVKTLSTTDEWVIPTGGGYFFVPSITALKTVIAKI